MVALRGRSKRGLLAPFGLSLTAYFLSPGVIGPQELTALVARTPAVGERVHASALVSAFGTIHASNFSMPRPISAAMPDSLGYVLAGLDSTNADITGSIRERILGDLMAELSPGLPSVPTFERRLKGDRLVASKPELATPQGAEPEWGRKGDRLVARTESWPQAVAKAEPKIAPEPKAKPPEPM